MTTSARPPVSQNTSTRYLPRTGLVLLAFICILVLAMFFAGWDKVVSAFSSLGFPKILALCGLAGLHYLLRAIRWHIMVRTARVPAVWGQNFRHYFGGFAMTATPGRLGELVRLRWLRLETGRGYKSLLPIAFADRAIELGGIVIVIAACLMSAGLGSVAAWWVVIVAALLVWLACRPKFLEIAVVTLWRMIGRRWARLFTQLRAMTRQLDPFLKPRVLGPTLALGIVGWAIEGIAFWMLLSWLGVDLSVAAAVAIFLIAILSGTLSGLPGGLGGTEATAVALLLLQGVPSDIAILATAIIRVTTLWFAVLIGVVVFPIAEAKANARAQKV